MIKNKYDKLAKKPNSKNRFSRSYSNNNKFIFTYDTKRLQCSRLGE